MTERGVGLGGGLLVVVGLLGVTGLMGLLGEPSSKGCCVSLNGCSEWVSHVGGRDSSFGGYSARSMGGKA